MARKTRERNAARLRELGIYDEIKNIPHAWKVMRDSGRDKLEKEIREYQQAKKTPEPLPSDLKRRKSNNPGRPKIIEPEQLTLDLEQPPPKRGPTGKGRPDGTLMVFWKDIARHRKTGKYYFPEQLKELKHQKRIYRNKEWTERDLLIELFGEKGNLKNEQGQLQEDGGAVGEIEVKIYYNERQKAELKKEFSSWTIIYHGKGIVKRDLLIALITVSRSVYNLSLTRSAMRYFINQVKKINPENGAWLQNFYKKYSRDGYYD
jgi:hypothetical protein